ncbi:hypothetical protein F4802DRAFT_609555 [Xylaria palmicola]|nr:hypothetical protein F4802DRAFT_609555 [Xylaria palmicola]
MRWSPGDPDGYFDSAIMELENPERYNPDEDACKNDVMFVFPDICPDYLMGLAQQHGFQIETIISIILDKQEKGESYPTQGPAANFSRKRKRTGESDEPECGSDYGDDDSSSSDECDPESVRSIKHKLAMPDYSKNTWSPEYTALARTLLSQDFPRVPQLTIRSLLLENNGTVFETYTALDEIIRNWDGSNAQWKDKKTLTKKNKAFLPDRLPNLDLSSYRPVEQAAFGEFVAARELRAAKDAKLLAKAEERNNFLVAKFEGNTFDCGICFEEFALNRMVRCEGETMHWFCRTCLRTQAESQIGMGKYELTCMSLDGCASGFSRAQRRLFLSKKLIVALERIEQEAVLRIAGIENLETCPFCPYAAEYPPVEVDKEFRCDTPRCRKVSCRHCRKETHIPKTCAEAAADRGLDAQHILEEAMSEALIRRCNKCQNAFIKQDGCNKVRCTKCGTLQCDVCRMTINGYSHFNDINRGGKTGQCPLFDESGARYEAEVSKAKAETEKNVFANNSGMVRCFNQYFLTTPQN